MGLIDDIREHQIVLISIDKENYNNRLIEIINAVGVTSDKICYVCLNKPYRTIFEMLTSNNFDTNKYFFIDVLTSSVQTPGLVENCEFVQSPGALTDISLAFTKATQDKGCKSALFDAISTLMIYQGRGEIIKLTQNLMTKARVIGIKSVYITLKEDSEELVKDLVMFVDHVIEL